MEYGMPIRVSAHLPSLDGATEWLNTNKMPVLDDNRPILVHFWAMSCPACKSNIPKLQELRTKYEPLGLHVVAIHMPRGSFDLDVEKIKTAAVELNITEPCAIDNEHAIGGRFETGGVWPVYFVFDHNSKLKRRAAGGLGLKMCEVAVRDLFQQA